MKKRRTGLFLALLLAVCLLPKGAFAAGGDFVVEDGVLTEYTGPGGNVVLPAGVTEIGKKAFAGCGSIVSLVVGEGVRTIGDEAFADCLGLGSVTLPEGLVEIGSHAFLRCRSLRELNIPASVTRIGSYAFEGTAWMAGQGEFPVYNGILLAYRGGESRVTIPDTVSVIGCAAFRKCGMTQVSIPDSVKTIEEYAFEQCANLECVELPDSVTAIGYAAFRSCTGLTGIRIPDGVTEIGINALGGCESLREVTLPDHIIGIGDLMFQDCLALESITLPDSLEEIGREAFKGCDRLREVNMGDRVERIGQDAFEGTPWLEEQGDLAVVNGILLQYRGRSGAVTLPESVTQIGVSAFYGRRLRELTLPQGLTVIGEKAFRRCSGLTSFTVPASVRKIGDSAFEEFKDLEEVWLQDGVTEVGERAFCMCRSLKSIYIPGSVTQIGEKAFCVMDYSKNPYEQPIEGLCIHGESGSYAETYARENGIPFVVGEGGAMAYASTQTVLVDGRAVEFPAYALRDERGNDTNYIKLRDVAAVLSGTPAQFDVGWDGTVNIRRGREYVPNGSEMSTPFSGDRAYESAAAVTKVDGTPAELATIVLKDDQGGAYTYYKLRDLGTALGFRVDWSAEKGIFIETK